MQNIKISKSASDRLKYLIANEVMDKKLRIKVTGGGCSGFQYLFDFTNQFNIDEDICFEDIVIIDKISLSFLKNAVIDYVETLGYSNFEIRNPNASAKCGCGNSFAIDLDDI